MNEQFQKSTSESSSETPADTKKRKRNNRVTMSCEDRGTITFASDRLTLDSLIANLESMLASAKKAKGMGITLDTYSRILRDQAKATS